MQSALAVYFKRYRMQIELPCRIEPWQGGDGIEFLAWQPKWWGLHAQAKWESFRNEMDGSVFPCLADREGCRKLVRDITSKSHFVAEATWLAVQKNAEGEDQAIGTIQGLRSGPVSGAIQNIGVIPSARGCGIGRELIRRALLGFHAAGCRDASLEVTIHNVSAIHLYRSVGFECKETVFKYGQAPIS